MTCKDDFPLPLKKSAYGHYHVLHRERSSISRSAIADRPCTTLFITPRSVSAHCPAMSLFRRPPLPARPLTGRCLCGSVSFTIRTPSPFGVNGCCCQDCQKVSGTTHFLSVFVRRVDLTMTGTISKYRKTADSGREIDICRCATCGTRLWHEPLAHSGICFVAGGTLDDTTWIIPTSFIYTDRANPGLRFPPDALLFPGPAPDRQVLIDKFTSTYGLDKFVLPPPPQSPSPVTGNKL